MILLVLLFITLSNCFSFSFFFFSFNYVFVFFSLSFLLIIHSSLFFSLLQIACSPTSSFSLSSVSYCLVVWEVKYKSTKVLCVVLRRNDLSSLKERSWYRFDLNLYLVPKVFSVLVGICRQGTVSVSKKKIFHLSVKGNEEEEDTNHWIIVMNKSDMIWYEVMWWETISDSNLLDTSLHNLIATYLRKKELLWKS